MNERTERINKVLNGLCAALDLHGESGTETLFLILCEVFDDANIEELENIRSESHDSDLMCDMLWPIAEKINDVAREQSASDIPPWNR
jgi:hypothetical protein